MKNKKIMFVSLMCGVIFTVAACGTNEKKVSSNSSETKASQSSAEHSAKAGEGHLDYDDQSEWEFTSGKMQSPIDIPSSKAEKMTEDGTIVLNYGTSISGVENNGHSIEVTDSGTAIINKREFELTQFHFHAESEHAVDGKHYPMEAHFVNKAQDGRIAVIGVFFTEGKENAGFGEVLADVSDEKNDPIEDIQTMFPENKSYYHYLGSLTTPPLVENVEWYVFKEPVEVSKEQIEDFKKLYSHNNREIQELNDRVILSHED